MPDSNSNVEQRIADACAAARAQDNPNISALAREFGVPHQRVRYRLSGRVPLNQRRNSPKTLDDTQEKAVIQWIRRIDSMGISPTPAMVVQCANEVLARSAADAISAENATKTPSKPPSKPSPKTPSNPVSNPVSNPASEPAFNTPPKVGKNWVYRFIARLPEDLQITTQKPLEKARFDAEDVAWLTHWYDLFEAELRHGQYSPLNIYNFDESGIQIGQNANQRVITQHPQRRLRGTDTRQSITIIEGVAADGFVMAPWFIFSGEKHMEHWFTPNIGCVPKDWCIAVSPNGYTSDELSIDWLLHFHEQTKYRVKRHEKRLLLMDGHKSHLTMEFLQRCDTFNIIPFIFPAHTTHLLQPLDAEPFHQLKTRYKQRNNEIAAYNGDAADKSIFLREMVGVRRDAMKQRTIRHAFEKRGIWPFNPNLVVEPLAATTEPAIDEWYLHGFHGPNDVPVTPPLASSDTNSPPQTIRKLKRTINKTVELEALDQISPSRKIRRFKMVSESCDIIHHIQHQTDSTLKRQNKHALSSNKSTKTKRQIPKMGPMTVRQAERSIVERQQKEELSAQRRFQREAKRFANISTPTPAGPSSNSHVDSSSFIEDPA